MNLKKNESQNYYISSSLPNFLPTYYRFSFVLLVISDLICNFAASNVKYIRVMEIKKVTYEEALARFKRSLEIKRNAEKRMAEEWKAMGLTGTIVTL